MFSNDGIEYYLTAEIVSASKRRLCWCCYLRCVWEDLKKLLSWWQSEFEIAEIVGRFVNRKPVCTGFPGFFV